MNDAANVYRLSEPQQRHIADVRAQIADFEQENLKLEGSIRRNDMEVATLRRHVALYLSQLALEHGLPAVGVRLSADNTTLASSELAQPGN